MGIEHKGSFETDGGIGSEEITLQRQDDWLLTKGTKLSDFLMSPQCPRTGYYLIKQPWFIVTDVKINREIEAAGDERGVSTISSLSCPRGILDDWEKVKEMMENDELQPWFMPLRNYKVATVMIEESMDHLWDIKNDKPVSIPFRTSAGSEMTGVRQRPILQVSFDYDLVNFKEEYVTQFQNAINIKPVKIAGRKYKAGCVQISCINADEMQQELDDGSELKWWRVSLVLQIDPKSWMREYINAGLYHRPFEINNYSHPYIHRKKPERIWTTCREFPLIGPDGKQVTSEQYDPDTGEMIKDDEGKPILVPVNKTERYYGSAVEMQRTNRENAVEVTEPMMLFPDNWMTPYKLPQNNTVAHISLGGMLLPVDKETGRQFLGGRRPDGGFSERFGWWWPTEKNEDGQDVFIETPGAVWNSEWDSRIINRSTIKGYPHPPCDFSDLKIPEHRGIRELA